MDHRAFSNMDDFPQALAQFIAYAYSVDREFGDAVREAARPYPGFGETATATGVVDKIAVTVDKLAQAYLKTATAYYETKGKIADLRLRAQGTPYTQAVNTAQGFGMNWLIVGAAGIAALLLLRK